MLGKSKAAPWHRALPAERDAPSEAGEAEPLEGQELGISLLRAKKKPLTESYGTVTEPARSFQDAEQEEGFGGEEEEGENGIQATVEVFC